MLVLESSGTKFYGTIDLDETEEKLEQLPDNIAIPDSLQDPKSKIGYDRQLKILSFKGRMSKEEQEQLSGLSPDPAFKNAVRQLAERSRKLKFDDKIRMYPMGLEREETLKLNGIERHFKIIVESKGSILRRKN
jgi:hypothetical protein